MLGGGCLIGGCLYKDTSHVFDGSHEHLPQCHRVHGFFIGVKADVGEMWLLYVLCEWNLERHDCRCIVHVLRSERKQLHL